MKRTEGCSLMVLMLFVSLLLLISVAAAQQVRDVSLNITLQQNINASQNYTKFILLRNNNYTSGITDSLTNKVYVNLSNGTSTIDWSVTKTINSYSESGFGTINVDEGIYFLCAFAEPANYLDPDVTNNVDCKDILTIGFSLNDSENLTSGNSSGNVSEDNSSLNVSSNITSNISSNITENVSANFSANTSLNISVNFSSNITSNISSNISLNNSVNASFNDSSNVSVCDCTLTIEATKNIFQSGEHLEFRIHDCGDPFSSTFNSSVEYWIEDGEHIVKQKLNTTSKAWKSYTPSVDIPERYFLVKARYVICANVSERLVVFTSEMEDQDNQDTQQTSISLDVPSESSDEIIFASITGHKADTGKTLISLWLEADGKKFSEMTKIYVMSKNSDFNFKVPVLLSVKKTGDYVVVAEGLDERDEKEIRITRSETADDTGSSVVKSTTKQSAAPNASVNQTKNLPQNQATGNKSAGSKTVNLSVPDSGMNVSPISRNGLDQLTANVAKSEQNDKSIFTGGSLIFAAVAITVCFFIFNRKARSFVLKKTKLFK